MAANTELFQKIYDQITEHPDTFDMTSWEGFHGPYQGGVCGTTRCVAGWALFFDRGVPLHEIVSHLPYSTLGAQALGIDESVADQLFYGPEGRAIEAVRLFAAGDEAGARAFLLVEE